MRVPIVALLTGALATGATAAPAGKPIGMETLFWSQAEKEAGFQHMEDRYAVHRVRRGAKVRALPAGEPLEVVIPLDGKPVSVDAFMAANHTAGLIVVQDGKVRLERYRLGYGPAGRWTSFSVAKSITSTLVGAAIKDGSIRSIEDPVTRYIPGLKGSVYEGVSVRQLLTMTSGVKWNEDYTDPTSDVARLFTDTPDPGVDATVSYMRKLPRESAPGARWVYKTGETNLIGVLVASATKRTLADYLSQTIWRPYGMEREAVWQTDSLGREPGGCCLSAALRDYARFGQFILDDGRIDGRAVLPAGWVGSATHKQVETGEPDGGYGYQWWTRDDGSVEARGIFGQAIHIDPKRRLVIAVSSAWPNATDPGQQAQRAALFAAVTRAAEPER